MQTDPNTQSFIIQESEPSMQAHSSQAVLPPGFTPVFSVSIFNLQVFRQAITNAILTLVHEISLYIQILRYDFSATLIPFLLFFLAGWHHAKLAVNDLALPLSTAILYCLLYAITFCLSNQLSGIEEDRINKPDRPLVKGYVSYQGAQIRWCFSMILYSFVGWWLGLLWQTLLWQVITCLHNFCGWSRNWLTKNLCNAIGFFLELSTAWQLATPLEPTILRWISILSVVMFFVIPLQDLRDMVGDYTIGRKTFPLVFGEKATRIFLLVCFLALPLMTHQFLIVPLRISFTAILCDILLAGISIALAIRVVLFREPRADHLTYLMLTYWFCSVLASSIILL
jgi:4-hydroxybenzoate polyprenyltransferase